MLSEEVTELMMSRVKIWGGDLTDDLKENIRKVWTLAWLGGYLEEDPSVIGEEVFLAP
jgi:hypothetical protein